MQNNTVLFDSKKAGYVFNIQNYSVHDGPGIRTIVFLKGCPLRCIWCSNPESQNIYPEMAYNSGKCIGITECGRCMLVCPNGACKTDAEGKIVIDRSNCDNCLKCTQVCPAKAQHTFGKLWSVDEVLNLVESEVAFFKRSGGGMTLSGGEPLMQIDFATNLLKEARARRINTAIETCGCVPWTHFEQAAPYLNNILFDIKCIDEATHLKFTQVSNKLILDNLKKIKENYPDIKVFVRTPVIPGFNDNKAEIEAIINYIKQFEDVSYELLPYHRMGQPKYEYLGREFKCKEFKLDDSLMAELKNMVKEAMG